MKANDRALMQNKVLEAEHQKQGMKKEDLDKIIIHQKV